MRAETLEAPAAIARLLAADGALIEALAADLRADDPESMLTVARGSSDHAAHYIAYLVMARLGRLVSSLPMSLITLHGAQLRCRGLVALAVSQSGQSPDLSTPMRYFAEHGARTVAIVNDAESPLARTCRWVLPLHAGPETSVAATKSFIAQMVVGARLVCAWSADAAMQSALHVLPEALVRASNRDWTPALPVLTPSDRLFVIGRGTGLAVAMEAALKLKETCGIQAEALSGAELRHGPMALVEAGYPVLVFAPPGPAQDGLLALAGDLRAQGARVLLAAPRSVAGAELELVTTGHEALDPIAAVMSFYGMVEALSRARGRDPDAPPGLAKVTRTC